MNLPVSFIIVQDILNADPISNRIRDVKLRDVPIGSGVDIDRIIEAVYREVLCIDT